jgi:hypothetical protein
VILTTCLWTATLATKDSSKTSNIAVTQREEYGSNEPYVLIWDILDILNLSNSQSEPPMAAILLEVKEAMAFLLEGIDLHKCWTPEAPEAASTSDDEEFLQNEIEFPCLCAELDYGQNGFDDYPSRMGWTVKRNAKNPLRRTNSASYSVGDAGSSCRLGFSSVRFLDPFDGAALETGYRILVQSHSAKITSAVDGKELGNNRRKITLKYAAKASYTGSSKRRKIHRDCAGDYRLARCGAPVAPQSLIISSSGPDATSLPSDEKTTKSTES